MFSKYYNNNQPLKELLIEGKKITFSPSTKSFTELLQKKCNLNLKDALINIHNPSDVELTKKSLIRLKYEELFMFMIKINYLKEKNGEYTKGYNRNIDKTIIDRFINTLPFKLTADQIK